MGMPNFLPFPADRSTWSTYCHMSNHNRCKGMRLVDRHDPKKGKVKCECDCHKESE